MSTRADLIRHQAGAAAATVVDFSVMVALVSCAGAPPAVGTAVGASCGAALNFALGRHWIFRALGGRSTHQAARYALVSLTSLLLNTGGVQVLAGVLHVPYVAARVVVALCVSVVWNFPMQRGFVFGKGAGR